MPGKVFGQGGIPSIQRGDPVSGQFVRPATSDQAGMGRQRPRRGREGLVEADATAGKRLEVRRRLPAISVQRQVRRADRVQDNEQDIRCSVGSRRQSRRGASLAPPAPADHPDCEQGHDAEHPGRRAQHQPLQAAPLPAQDTRQLEAQRDRENRQRVSGDPGKQEQEGGCRHTQEHEQREAERHQLGEYDVPDRQQQRGHQEDHRVGDRNHPGELPRDVNQVSQPVAANGEQGDFEKAGEQPEPQADQQHPGRLDSWEGRRGRHGRPPAWDDLARLRAMPVQVSPVPQVVHFHRVSQEIIQFLPLRPPAAGGGSPLVRGHHENWAPAG